MVKSVVVNMKSNNKKYILAWIILGTISLLVIAWLLGYTPKLIIGFGSIIVIMAWALWNPPEKHKEFSDRDRLQAMSRALGGSPPPELWTPDIPGKAKKRKRS
jgi:predicted tellurium resistance membrane protein TerC